MKLKTSHPAVKQISDMVKESTGFGFESIIALLIPMLFKLPCFQQDNTDPATFLSRRFNERTGKYRQLIVRKAREETQAASLLADKDLPESERRGILSNRDLDIITKHTFDVARTNPKKAASLYESML